MTENAVKVDHAALADEAERVELPPDTVAPGAGSVGDAGGGAPPPAEPQAPQPAPWSSITPGIVQALDLAVCPNWDLTDDEKRALNEALAPALDQLFPGGIGDERWAPYFRLLAVTAAIAGSRFDRERMRLKPLRKPKSKDGAATAAGPAYSSFAVDPGDGRH